MLHEAKVFLERGYNEGDSKDLPLPPCDEFLALEQAIREMAVMRVLKRERERERARERVCVCACVCERE